MKHLKTFGVGVREGLSMTIVHAVLYCVQIALIRCLGKATLMGFVVLLSILWIGFLIAPFIRWASLGGNDKLGFIQTPAHASYYRVIAMTVGAIGIFLAIIFLLKIMRNPDGVSPLWPAIIALFCGLSAIRNDLAERETNTPRKH